MTIPDTKTKSDSGSVLVVALVMSTVLAIILGSYLTLVASRNRITMRSQAWNEAIPVLEAGIEEGFTHLYDDSGSLANNGWSAVLINSNLVYQKTRYFTNNSFFNDKSYCVVTLSNAVTTQPVIYSQGFVPAPLGTNYISRLVQVVTTNPVIFSKAVAATGAITLGGSGTTVDSFNSSNPLYSSNGMYVPSLREANGGLVTDSTNNPAISVGTGHVYGKTDTGPLGTVSTSGGGSVGDLAWGSGIEPGYSNNNMNVVYPDQTAPAGYIGWLAPLPLIYFYGGTNYTYNLGGGNYTQSGNFSISGQTVVVTGNATFVVTGNFSMTGHSFIYVAPGASLQLIVGGSTTVLAGGGIVNGTGTAANFSYIGLPSNTSVSYSGGSAFIGTVNAPEADFSISGGSDFSGAAIVKSFTDSGGSSVHYDESLGGNGLLVMTSYTEL
jgi:hypothetical protein